MMLGPKLNDLSKPLVTLESLELIDATNEHTLVLRAKKQYLENFGVGLNNKSKN